MSPTAEPWGVYRGTGLPGSSAAGTWPEPPPWRRFHNGPCLPAPPDDPYASSVLGDGTKPLPAAPGEAERVNAALALCRPLLVTGEPGSGRSALAYRISRELGLGRVLRWRLTSVSTLQEGLYDGSGRLGPLGTAFLPYRRPRVLLLDRLDRAEIALPEDLCTVLDAGGFTVPGAPAQVATDDDAEAAVALRGGAVQCHAFPLVVITTGGDRDIAPALAAQCVPLTLARPDRAALQAIAAARFPQGLAEDVLAAFLDRAEAARGPVVRRLLGALHLTTQGALASLAEERSWQEALDTVWAWTEAEQP
ncbi:MoxR family ATPase [Streptomyces sp. NPDC049541]|uniref:MoxR family ATPase n=1 Tax=Streptomyces sp. NPDC049541 TaxID=3365594 RepID=UPI00378ECE1C